MGRLVLVGLTCRTFPRLGPVATSDVPPLPFFPFPVPRAFLKGSGVLSTFGGVLFPSVLTGFQEVVQE